MMNSGMVPLMSKAKASGKPVAGGSHAVFLAPDDSDLYLEYHPSRARLR